MKTNRKTIKMPVRYLMNLVLVGLLFVGLSYVTGSMLSTYQNKVLLTVGINIILAVSLNVATGYLGQLPLATPVLWRWVPTPVLCSPNPPVFPRAWPLPSVWCWPGWWPGCSGCSSVSRPCG